jgi:hypothetical protein
MRVVRRISGEGQGVQSLIVILVSWLAFAAALGLIMGKAAQYIKGNSTF